ncbi:hypothetical protein VTH06DRAFT_1152 [Thermothelomyces fergusii]
MTLTPVQVADYAPAGGQSWNIVTTRRQVKGNNAMLVANTLTQTCLDFDPHKQAGAEERPFKGRSYDIPVSGVQALLPDTKAKTPQT